MQFDFPAANLYLILFDAVLANPEKVGHGREGYFFVENGEHTWYDLSKAIGGPFVKAGLSKDSEPTTLTDEELIKYTGSVVCCSSVIFSLVELT